MANQGSIFVIEYEEGPGSCFVRKGATRILHWISQRFNMDGLELLRQLSVLFVS
jgi:hypothetical protein